jgi:hypothetical protein
LGTGVTPPAFYAGGIMVQSDHDEERIARIVRIVERLLCDRAALTTPTAKVITFAVVKPSVPVMSARKPRRT